MIERLLAHLLETEHFKDPEPKIAFVVGARQCGKTTLARTLQDRRGTPTLYRNWDDLSWRSEVARHPYRFLDDFQSLHHRRKPMVVLDEVHKLPQWKRYLKGLWDTRHGSVDILVTSSGRLDVYRRGGDCASPRRSEAACEERLITSCLFIRTWNDPFVPERSPVYPAFRAS